MSYIVPIIKDNIIIQWFEIVENEFQAINIEDITNPTLCLTPDFGYYLYDKKLKGVNDTEHLNIAINILSEYIDTKAYQIFKIDKDWFFYYPADLDKNFKQYFSNYKVQGIFDINQDDGNYNLNIGNYSYYIHKDKNQVIGKADRPLFEHLHNKLYKFKKQKINTNISINHNILYGFVFLLFSVYITCIYTNYKISSERSNVMKNIELKSQEPNSLFRLEMYPNLKIIKKGESREYLDFMYYLIEQDIVLQHIEYSNKELIIKSSNLNQNILIKFNDKLRFEKIEDNVWKFKL